MCVFGRMTYVHDVVIKFTTKYYCLWRLRRTHTQTRSSLLRVMHHRVKLLWIATQRVCFGAVILLCTRAFNFFRDGDSDRGGGAPKPTPVRPALSLCESVLCANKVVFKLEDY